MIPLLVTMQLALLLVEEVEQVGEEEVQANALPLLIPPDDVQFSFVFHFKVSLIDDDAEIIPQLVVSLLVFTIA